VATLRIVLVAGWSREYDAGLLNERLRSPGNLGCDSACGRRRSLVLPDPNHRPPGSLKLLRGVGVSLLIRLDLRAPPVAISLRPSAVRWTPMPEAAIDEDRDTRSRKDDIDRPCRTWNQPLMQPVAKSEPVKR
jgi:hypothetical protein